MNDDSRITRAAIFGGACIFWVAVLLIFSPNIEIIFTSANGQLGSDNMTVTTASPKPSPLTVLLIHGYFEDFSIWHDWENFLTKDHIPYIKVNFGSFQGSYYDQCGRAVDHADDLNNIIQNIIGHIKTKTGHDRVNIVTHSKGGLDARVYLANYNTSDVANLIMIGTPNAGSPLANLNDYCWPAVSDIRPGAADTKVGENNNTKYYTIAGDWKPSLISNCPPVENLFGFDWPGFQKEGYFKLKKPNDGIVPIASVESEPYFKSLGHTPDCHTNLLNKRSFTKAEPYLLLK